MEIIKNIDFVDKFSKQCLAPLTLDKQISHIRDHLIRTCKFRPNDLIFFSISEVLRNSSQPSNFTDNLVTLPINASYLLHFRIFINALS